jgi:hypothetical protein
MVAVEALGAAVVTGATVVTVASRLHAASLNPSAAAIAASQASRISKA